MSTEFFLVGAIVAAVLALALAFYFARWVLAMDRGSDLMVSISNAIREGADAFMRREYTWVAVFVVVLAVLIGVLLPFGGWKAAAYVSGALLSAGAGFVGMRIATAANSRTTEAARTGGTPSGAWTPGNAGESAGPGAAGQPAGQARPEDPRSARSALPVR